MSLKLNQTLKTQNKTQIAKKPNNQNDEKIENGIV